MKRYLIVLLISISILTVSCQKEEMSTGEMIGQELQSAMKEKSVLRVKNVSLGQTGTLWFSGDDGTNYKFQNEFVYINGIGYNLNNLISYRIDNVYSISDNSISIKFLILTFY